MRLKLVPLDFTWIVCWHVCEKQWVWYWCVIFASFTSHYRDSNPHVSLWNLKSQRRKSNNHRLMNSVLWKDEFKWLVFYRRLWLLLWCRVNKGIVGGVVDFDCAYYIQLCYWLHLVHLNSCLGSSLTLYALKC